MDPFAKNLIAALGGLTAVSEKTKASVSTVFAWTRKLPRSRLEHLKLIAERDGVSIDWDTGNRIENGGDTHAGADSSGTEAIAPGKSGDLTAAQVAA